ncbi:MAG: NADH-quinone oxidoreductase subunit M [Chloroflexi bacterium]|nr:NADH-quinone oxidoreductase subunit M [Chloroflexota bacterium]
MYPYLSTVVFLPVAGSIVIALLGARERLVKWVAAVFTFTSLLAAIGMLFRFDRTIEGMQFEEKALWIPALNANFHLGVDGLSLPLVVLTAFLGFMVVLISWKEHLRVREYFVWLLLLETSILGVFSSLDLLLFFIFWEIELIPMYFLISVWGAGRREYSAIKYMIYTLFGSAFMLAGILSLYFTTGSLSIVDMAGGGIAQAAIPLTAIFFFLLIGFAVKLPVFPFHTWLPDAHTDAPTAGSVMLAGALIKMGGYGMIRVSVSLFPDIARTYAPLLITLAVIGVLYGAALTLRQNDIKRMIAYSSVSHMGYVLLGVFALGQVSLTGATLQMVSHGLLTGLLFAVAGLTMHNVHERDLRKMGGLARQMPVIAVVFSIAGLGSLGLPMTSGFIAEFITFAGSFASDVFGGMQAATILAVAGVVFAAGYILWMIQRAFYGPVKGYVETHIETETLEVGRDALARYQPKKVVETTVETPIEIHDADALERVYMFSFVALILIIGIYPAVLTDIIQTGISPVVRLLGG